MASIESELIFDDQTEGHFETVLKKTREFTLDQTWDWSIWKLSVGMGLILLFSWITYLFSRKLTQKKVIDKKKRE